MSAPETPTVGRQFAIIGLVFGVISAIAAVWWQVAIPLGILAVIASYAAMRMARRVDPRTVGLAIGGLAAGIAGILLGGASALLQNDDSGGSKAGEINGIITSTPDAAHQPQLDLEPGAKCTVDLDGLRLDGALRNHSATNASYRVKVVWSNDDKTLAEATSLIGPLAPDETKAFTAVSPQTGNATTTCAVTEIDRTPA